MRPTGRASSKWTLAVNISCSFLICIVFSFGSAGTLCLQYTWQVKPTLWLWERPRLCLKSPTHSLLPTHWLGSPIEDYKVRSWDKYKSILDTLFFPPENAWRCAMLGDALWDTLNQGYKNSHHTFGQHYNMANSLYCAQCIGPSFGIITLYFMGQ